MLDERRDSTMAVTFTIKASMWDSRGIRQRILAITLSKLYTSDERK